MSEADAIMTRAHVQQRYHAVRRRQGTVWLTTVLLALLGAWGVVLLAAAVVDYLLLPAVPLRCMLAGVVYGGGLLVAGCVAVFEWRRRMARRVLVARVEECLPNLRHGLATVLDRAGTTHAVEARMVDELAQRVGTAMAATSVRAVVTARPLVIPALALACVLAAVLLWCLRVPYGGLALRHIIAPTAERPYTRVTDAAPTTALIKGSNMVFVARVEGRACAHAAVHLTFDGQVRQTVHVALSNHTARLALAGMEKPFRYWLTANDGATAPRTVTVVGIPCLTAAYAAVQWPAYTGRGSTREKWTELAVLPDSAVTVCWWFAAAVTNVQLTRAGGASCALTGSGAQWQAGLAATTSVEYVLRACDAQTPAGVLEQRFTVQVQPDAPPTIIIRQPLRDVIVPEDYGFTIEAVIDDDVGVRDATLVYQINDRPPVRIPLQRRADQPRMLVVTQRFNMADVTVRSTDIIAWHIAAHDVRPGAPEEGRSRLMFVEVLPPTYAGMPLPAAGGPSMLNPFPRLIRIQKQVVADSFTIVTQTNAPDATRVARTDLAQREQMMSDACRELRAVFIAKGTNMGATLKAVSRHEVAVALQQLTRDFSLTASNYTDNCLALAHGRAQRILTFMLQFKMSSESGGKDSSEELRILQALRLAERAASKKIEDERQRRLARLGDLEEQLDELQKLQRQIANEMRDQSEQSESGESDKQGEQGQQGKQGKEGKQGQQGQQGSCSIAAGMAGTAAQQAGRMGASAAQARAAFDAVRDALARVSQLLADGKADEARAALQEALAQTAAAERKLMQEHSRELADGLGALGQQLAMLGEYQDAIRAQTAQQRPNADTRAVQDQQRTAQAWWEEVAQQATALSALTSGGMPAQEEALTRITRALSQFPVAENMRAALSALQARRPGDALPAQVRAVSNLVNLAELAHRLQRTLRPDPLQQMDTTARALATLAHQQHVLVQRLAAGQPLPDGYERQHLAGKQQQVLRQLQAALAAGAESGGEGFQAGMGNAILAAQAALGMLEGTRQNPAAGAQAALVEKRIRAARTALIAALQHSAVERLTRLGAEALRWATQMTSNAMPAVFDEELATLQAALADEDVAVRLALAAQRWQTGRAGMPHSALFRLADECARACAVIEQPQVARVENFMVAALQDRRADARIAQTSAAAEAAVDSVLDTQHVQRIVQMLSAPLTSATDQQQQLRVELRALEPLAEAWLRALVKQQRELLKTDEECPPRYRDAVNEYFKVLSYK